MASAAGGAGSRPRLTCAMASHSTKLWGEASRMAVSSATMPLPVPTVRAWKEHISTMVLSCCVKARAPAGVAAAASLGRFTQEPLAEFCSLWSCADSTETFGYEAFFLDLHPLKVNLTCPTLP